MDKAGNVIATFPGTDPEAPTVMIAAHMDSLGFIIRRIDEDGFLQFDRLGGIPEKVLPGLSVSIGTTDGNYVPGIIAVKAHHITPPEEKMRVDGFRSLHFDIGAKSKEEVLATGIRVGCPVVYKPSFGRLLGDRVTGTTLDDRAGCAALVGIAKMLHDRKPNGTVALVASVWEEFNIRGAVLAARKVKPDVCLYIDCGQDGSTPEMHNSFNNVEMEGGPTICLYNFHSRGTLNGCIGHQGLYRLALKAASERGIPVQETASLGWLTETAYLQMEGDYVACLDIGFPHRYAHSPIEVVSLRDVERLVELVSEMAITMDRDFQLSRYTCGAVEAAKILAEKGMQVRVIDLYSVKPIDQESIVKAAQETGGILTIEDHNIYGGLGGAVAEVVTELAPTKIVRMGVPDVYGRSGNPDRLYEMFGLTPDDIAEKMLAHFAPSA